MLMLRRLLFVTTMAVALLSAACESDADRIRELNQGSATATASGGQASAPTATPTALSAEIGSVDIQDGDCITSSLPEGITVESVVIVPCSGAWEYRVLNSFEVADQEDYPGEDSLSRAALRQCDSRYTYILYPTQESWEAWLAGDRTISCLQHSFGLAETDPAKLDRLVGSRRLNDGDCFNEAPETNGLLVESVPCGGDWQNRIVSVFSVPDADAYPGEDFLNQAAYQQCDRRHTYFFLPSQDTWHAGDRVIACVQESFGLAETHPAKLDRLVGSRRLNDGDCFNEAPETGGSMVELVDCAGGWEYRVVSSFAVADSTEYPGEDSLSLLANERCDRRFTEFYYPLSESWAAGNRTITCLQESFGLAETHPAKLDRLIRVSRLDVGECYSEAPETGGRRVELVDCSGDWEYRVVDVFLVPPSDAYPGDDYLQDQADSRCATPWDYYYSPSSQSWERGDRRVMCVRTP